MNGIARTTLLVFTWVPLQRWLLVIGLVMVAGGQWVFLRGPQANPFFPVLSVLGPVIALICFALFFATSGRYGWIAGLAIIAASRPLEWLLARHELLGVTSNPSPAPVAAVFIT